MNEKIMVSDALHAINSSLSSLGSMIPQTENLQLRQTLQQIRKLHSKKGKMKLRLYFLWATILTYGMNLTLLYFV